MLRQIVLLSSFELVCGRSVKLWWWICWSVYLCCTCDFWVETEKMFSCLHAWMSEGLAACYRTLFYIIEFAIVRSLELLTWRLCNLKYCAWRQSHHQRYTFTLENYISGFLFEGCAMSNMSYLYRVASLLWMYYPLKRASVFFRYSRNYHWDVSHSRLRNGNAWNLS
jgi:hypothetical protein